MNKLRKICIILILAALPLTAGCEAMLERSFPYEQPHVTAPTSPGGDQGAVRVNDFPEMRDKLISTAAMAQPLVKMRISVQSGQSGDIDTILSEMLMSLMENDPVFAYAVSAVVPKSTRIVSEYEVEFNIAYKATPDDIRSIQRVADADGVKQKLADMIINGREKVLIRISDYTAAAYNFDELYDQTVEELPLYTLGLGRLVQNSYPNNTGRERIFALEPKRTLTQYTIDRNISRTREVVSEILEGAPKGDRIETLEYLHDYLCVNVSFNQMTLPVSKISSALSMENGVPYSVYGALAGGDAAALGWALAFKQLCAEADIECMLVSGMMGQTPHVWNLVWTDEGWFHIDAAGDSAMTGEQPDDQPIVSRGFFLKDDEEMAQTHTVETTGLPISERIQIEESTDQ